MLHLMISRVTDVLITRGSSGCCYCLINDQSTEKTCIFHAHMSILCGNEIVCNSHSGCSNNDTHHKHTHPTLILPQFELLITE